ncbi:Armadillo-type fold [Amanita muscaria]
MRWVQKKDSTNKPHDTDQPPHWYISKFLDKSINAKQAGSLSVSLRSHELGWLQTFVNLRGTSVLAQSLQHISRNGPSRRDYEAQLEYEIAKCLKQILNNKASAKDALTHSAIVQQIASALNSSNIPTRKLILDLLTFIVYFEDGKAVSLVVSALEALSAANCAPNEGENCYEYWFKSFEQALTGRGKMGSLVGASEEVRRAGLDTSLNEYTLANLCLINGILSWTEDLDLRLHHRSRLDAAGLDRVIDLCRSFAVPSIDTQISILENALQEDQQKFRECLDQKILKDVNNPQEVYNAITAKTDGTRAKLYFLSMMQHLLLIHEDGAPMVHYFQLLDSIVSDVVLNKKLARAEQRLGFSVERMVTQFNDSEKTQTALDDAAEARALAMKLKLEKEALEDEIALGQDGLVGNLKEQVARLDEKLGQSRETTSRIQGQLVTQKAHYEERIAQLEAQILELFRMVKEVGSGALSHLDSGSLERQSLIQSLEKQYQRHRTITILEGRDRRARKSSKADEDLANTDSTPGKSSGVTRQKSSKNKGLLLLDEDGRVSQFMDAEEADAQEQIQQQLAAGVKIVSSTHRIHIHLTKQEPVFSSYRSFLQHTQYSWFSSTCREEPTCATGWLAQCQQFVDPSTRPIYTVF